MDYGGCKNADKWRERRTRVLKTSSNRFSTIAEMMASSKFEVGPATVMNCVMAAVKCV